MAEDKMSPHLRPISHDAHEERIQRNEAEVSELKAATAEMRADMKHLTTEVTNLGTRISEKIDGFSTNLVQKVQEEHQRLTNLKERVTENTTALAKIEEEKRRAADRWDTWKKFLATAATGAVAIGLKELVVFVGRHM